MIIQSIQSDKDFSGYAFSLTITNYEQLHKYKNDYEVVIVDEFHSFGAFPVPSQRTVNLREICKGAYVIMLSGTPTPESYSQLFNAFSVSERGPWDTYKNFYSWSKHYVKVKLKYLYNRQINDYSDADIDKIEKDIEPYAIKFTQEQAGFLSEVSDEVLLVETPDKVKNSIKKLMTDRVFKTSTGDTVLADTAVKMMQKIHQLSSGTVKTEEGNYIAFDDFKARFIATNFTGKKIAVFYKYVAERTHLMNVFKDAIVTSPQEFNESDYTKVYISQIQSGREGINLSSADYIIMYNIDFSALSYWQARERLNSKDRQKESKVYWIMSTEGIEQKIYDVVQRKKDFTIVHFREAY